MALPEIPTEENEQPKTTCKFCGKEGASKAHERFCSKNPNNPRLKKKVAMKQETVLQESTLTPIQTPAEPLIISDVQPYLGDEVAWFEGVDNKFYMKPRYIGIVNNVPMVLVLFNDGAIIPPSSIPEFIGMLPIDASFQSKHNNDYKPFPPYPEEIEEEKKTEIKSQLLDEKITCTPESKQIEKPKKSWWPFSHKKPVIQNTTHSDKTDIKELVDGAINATG